MRRERLPGGKTLGRECSDKVDPNVRIAANGRGCVKTKNGTRSQNFGLPECAAFDYFWLGNGRKTPEIEIALSFYTASANSCRSVDHQKTRSDSPLRGAKEEPS